MQMIIIIITRLTATSHISRLLRARSYAEPSLCISSLGTSSVLATLPAHSQLKTLKVWVTSFGGVAFPGSGRHRQGARYHLIAKKRISARLERVSWRIFQTL